MRENLLDVFVELVDCLNEKQIGYAVCGGLAVLIHGHVRATRDIDLLVQRDDLDEAYRAVAPMGFTLIAGPIPFQAGTPEERTLYRASRVEEGELITIDFLVVSPVLEDVWQGRQVFEWQGRKIPVVSIEGLAKMKLMAGRHQDLADLENLGIAVEGDVDDESK